MSHNQFLVMQIAEIQNAIDVFNSIQIKLSTGEKFQLNKDSNVQFVKSSEPKNGLDRNFKTNVKPEDVIDRILVVDGKTTYMIDPLSVMYYKTIEPANPT